jgi:hypothetical protein
MTEPLTPSEVQTYYAVRLSKELRTSGGPWRIQCPLHHGRKLSFAIDPETGRWFCHSECLRGGDILELERLVYGGTFPDVKRRVFQIVGRAVDQANMPQFAQPPRFTGEQLSDGEFFRIGLTWRIERALEVLKEYLWSGDGEALVGEEIAFLTAKPAEADRWTMLEAAEAMLAADPDLVAECRREAQDTQFQLALGIRAAGTKGSPHEA